MKKIFSIFAALLFAGSMMAAPTLQATLDFTDNTDWKLPTEGTKTANDYSNGTYTINLVATTAYYFNSTNNYLMLGKNNSKLTFPAFTWNTTKIVVTTTNGSSTSAKGNIFVGDNAVSTEVTGKGTLEFEIADEDDQAAGTIYVFKLLAAYNIQITKIEIYGETIDPSAPRIEAKNLDLGEIVIPADQSTVWTDTNVVVGGANLTYDIVLFEHSDNLTITNSTELPLPSTGGKIKFQFEVTTPGKFEGTLTLQSEGADEKVVKVTATVIKRHEVPTAALNAIMKMGTNTYDEEDIKVGETTYEAIRVGKSGNNGSMSIAVGAGAEKLFFYAAAWNNGAGDINISAPDGVTLSAPGELLGGKLTLRANSGIAGNTYPYTFAEPENVWKYLFEINLSGNTGQIDITLASGSAQRFIVWEAKQVGGNAPTAIENAVVTEGKAVKQIVNGQVIILRNGVRYNVIGQVIE